MNDIRDNVTDRECAEKNGKSRLEANVMTWTWASDKCCRTCTHYDGSYCDIDNKRYGENYYCSSWRP